MPLTDTMRRLERMEWLLDRSIGIPGLNKRIGLDGIIGLIPGIGDAAAAALALYAVAEAWHLKAPKRLLARMLGNVLFDTAVGAVPVAGDLFDFLFQSNTRNLRLLKDWLAQHPDYVVALDDERFAAARDVSAGRGGGA